MESLLMILLALLPILYDVDWGTVNKIEVLRGPSASLYGGGGAAGCYKYYNR